MNAAVAAVFVFVGKRPFGVSLLYMGWDKHYGFQLYQSDPSGNYGGWKATCIGNNSAVSVPLSAHCVALRCGVVDVQACERNSRVSRSSRFLNVRLRYVYKCVFRSPVNRGR